MDSDRVSLLGRLNRYQIAGLAMTASTIAAIAVMWAVRNALRPRFDGSADQTPLTPAAPGGDGPTAPSNSTPNHFSEDLLVPGVTESGAEITAQDATEGRAPEGI